MKLKNTRPTAINLKWAVTQMRDFVHDSNSDIVNIKIGLLEIANQIKEDDQKRCHNLCLNGAELIPNNSNIITVCNTGGLATSGIGTALGVIQYAHAQEKK